jgi:hypothetical protein
MTALGQLMHLLARIVSIKIPCDDTFNHQQLAHGGTFHDEIGKNPLITQINKRVTTVQECLLSSSSNTLTDLAP